MIVNIFVKKNTLAHNYNIDEWPDTRNGIGKTIWPLQWIPDKIIQMHIDNDAPSVPERDSERERENHKNVD